MARGHSAGASLKGAAKAGGGNARWPPGRFISAGLQRGGRLCIAHLRFLWGSIIREGSPESSQARVLNVAHPAAGPRPLGFLFMHASGVAVRARASTRNKPAPPPILMTQRAYAQNLTFAAQRHLDFSEVSSGGH